MGWEQCDLTSPDAQYNYCASGPLAVVFTFFFAVPLVLHVVQARLYKTSWCWIICMAAAWELLGFIMRIVSTVNQTQNSVTVPAGLLILLAPLWINAFVYVIFGRMVYYFVPDKKIGGIRAEKMATWFVWMDVLAFVIQAAGGSLDQGDDLDLIKIGLNLYTAGIAVQQAFVAGFVVMMVLFHRKMVRGERHADRTQWPKLLYPMYATVALITGRIIYRLCEFANNGSNRELIGHEYYMYVLDASPMLLCMIIWNAFHPGKVLVGADAQFPKKINKRRQKSDERRLRRREEKEKTGASRHSTRLSESSTEMDRLSLVAKPLPYSPPRGHHHQAASYEYNRENRV